MQKKTGGRLFSLLCLDPGSATPLYRQLETKIRQMILDGNLETHARMPSSRLLAVELGISRLTVKNVYEQLVIEGFLVARRGSGTYVAQLSSSEFRPHVQLRRRARKHHKPHVLPQVLRIQQSKATTRLSEVQAFRPGIPALDLFPRRAWAEAYTAALRSNDNTLLGYGPSSGLDELKSSIAMHVLDHRGIECSTGQIIITSGAQQAFSLVALTLLKAGTTVWMEDPGHIAVRDAMVLQDIDVRPVSIDADGFNLADGIRRHRRCEALLVTPSHQHPLGITMSLTRRLELLEFARSSRCWIIEDDYDSEFHFEDRPLPALQALDKHGQVLYVGSFSKSLFPALRLGYMICPPALAGAFASAATLLSQNVSLLKQKALVRFMQDGSFTAHIRRMKLAYRRRRDLLAEALTDHAGGLLQPEPCLAGMHQIVWLNDPRQSDAALAKALWDAGIDCLPISIFCHTARLRPGLLLGFACAEDHLIGPTAQRAVEILRRASGQL